ncbi:MAG: hypothetical protein E7666_07930 [Ruminococcaceae bacterium]|nr:hypothetical protein [Oscillospiraceae bacterium]
MSLTYSLFAASAGGIWERLSEWYEGSLIRELLTYISEEYFTVELGSYQNFAFSGSSGNLLRNIILAAACGIIIAALMTLYMRRGLGGFVRRLIATGATSPEQAKTLMELGYFRSVAIRRELSRGSALRMVVRCREQEAHEAELAERQSVGKRASETYRHDFLSAHFYVPEDLRHRAEIRFDAKGSGWLPTVITIAVTVVAASAICWFLPDLIQMADNLISFFQ